MSDYKSFENYIKEKSGVSVKICGENMPLNDQKGLAALKSDGVFADKVSGKTFFNVNLNGKLCLAEIDGATEGEIKLAGLIKEIADNFSVSDGLTKSDFLSALIKGEMSAAQAKRLAVKFRLPESLVFVIIISVKSGDVSDVENVITNYCGNSVDGVIKTGDSECLLIKFCDTDDDYLSSGDYAEHLLQTVYEETGADATAFVGGKVNRLIDLSASYIQAKTAQSFVKASGATGRIHNYKEYVLSGIIQDLPKHKLKEYFDLLADGDAKEIFSDKDLLTTAEEFLNNNLNVSETSRTLFIHRNTLSYRLDKIEKITGLNIRNFPDAVTFRLLTYLNELFK